MEEMNLDGPPSSSNDLLSKQHDGTLCGLTQSEAEEIHNTDKAPIKPTVSFGGKMKSPFLGKTLPCDDSDDDEEEDEDEEGGQNTASPTRLHPSSLGSDEQNNQQLDLGMQSVEDNSSDDDGTGARDRHTKSYEMENETEEELNAYDMRRYESNSEGITDSSDDSDTSDEDSDSPCNEDGATKAKRPSGLLTFVSGKQARSALGEEVHRPKPIMGGSPTPSGGENRKNSSDNEQGSDNDGDESSCTSDSSSSSNSVASSQRLCVPGNDNTSLSSDEPSDGQASSGENRRSCCSSVSDNESFSSDESNELSGGPSDSEDEDAQVTDVVDVSCNLNEPGVSSPMEMELDGAICGNGIDSVGEHESHVPEGNIECTNEAGTSQRNSLSVEDVEEIIRENSSDEDSGPASKLCFSDDEGDDSERNSPCHDQAEEDISSLLDDALEIKHCSAGTMKAIRSLFGQLSDSSRKDERCDQPGPAASDHGFPIQLPGSSCESFWIDKVLTIIAPDSKVVKELEKYANRPLATQKIYDAFHSKLSSADVSHIEAPVRGMPNKILNPQNQALFVGSLGAADCRLALLSLRISHVIRIEYFPPDNLEAIDGVKQFSHILPCSGKGSTSRTIGKAVDDIVSSLQSNPLASILVACPTGNEYACAACALFFMRDLGMRGKDALNLVAAARPSSNVEPSWVNAEDDVPLSHCGLQHAQFSKRILSSQKLSNLTETNCFAESPKRQRLKEYVCSGVKKDGTSAVVPPMPSLDLGPSRPSLRLRSTTGQADEPALEGSFECERYLSEELNYNYSQRENASTPVPLLTPPASPLVVRSDEGETTVCEWPSNLAVDAAMTATMSLPPPSQSCPGQAPFPSVEYLKTPRSQPVRASTTGLTPKLKGIQVSYQ